MVASSGLGLFGLGLRFLAVLPCLQGLSEESRLCQPFSRCKFRIQNETCRSLRPRTKMSKADDLEHFDMLVRYSRQLLRPLTVLHIGTNDLKDEELDWYYDLRRFTHDSLHLVFVEPQPWIMQKLRSRVQEWLGQGSIRFLEAALCFEETPEKRFYAVSERLYEDFPKYSIPKSMIGRISSLSKGHVISLILQFASEEDLLSKPELVESYLEEIAVRCLTADRILQEAALQPWEVDLLVCDLEGFDTQLLPGFFQMRAFRPLSLMFEHLGQRLPDVVTRWTVSELASRGYAVYCHFADIVALRQVPHTSASHLRHAALSQIAALPSFGEEIERFGASERRGYRDIEFASSFISPCLPLILATHIFGKYDFHNCPLRKIAVATRLQNIRDMEFPVVLPEGSVVSVDTDSLQAFRDFMPELQSVVVLVVGRHRRAHLQRHGEFQLTSVLLEILACPFVLHIFMQNPELSHPDYEALPMGFNNDAPGLLTKLGKELAIHGGTLKRTGVHISHLARSGESVPTCLVPFRTVREPLGLFHGARSPVLIRALRFHKDNGLDCALSARCMLD